MQSCVCNFLVFRGRERRRHFSEATVNGFGSTFSQMSATVVDGKGHVSGRLAAALAKQLLDGKSFVVVRSEDIVTNGDHRFNYHKYRRYLNKTTNTNPRHGPFHQRAPSQMFLKTVRGMVNYKTARGAAAFARIKVFEGVPPKYANAPTLVVPQALRVVAISNERPVTSLGTLATTFGWKYAGVVKRLETARLNAGKTSWEARKAKAKRIAGITQGQNKQLGQAAANFLATFKEGK
jgi:large subunit ribosomal protein L13Ae